MKIYSFGGEITRSGINSSRNVSAGGDISGQVFTGDIRGNVYINQILNIQQVSYSKIEVAGQHIQSILQQIITSLAVNININVDQENVPFILPDKFDSWNNENKLFLYGIGGCGKSRSIVRIIEEKLSKPNFQIIYIINPRNVIGKKSENITIPELLRLLNDKDIIIWDNFPLGIEGGQEPEIGRKLLLSISMAVVKNLFVTLYSAYLEQYRSVLKNIPELYIQEVSYDKEKINKFLGFCGQAVTRFRNAYQQFILKDIDEISELLWKNEPTPLNVYRYYEELIKITSKSWLNPAVELAKVFLPSTNYYRQQFLSIFSERPNEAEFLYTLKLSLDLGLGRTSLTFLEELQFKIFKSKPPKYPSSDLSTWVFLSGPYYSMYDVAKNSIDYPVDRKPEIIKYLTTSNFLEIIPTHEGSKATLRGINYRFGMFIGENIQFAELDRHNEFFSDEIYNLMNNDDFARGLARGLTLNFPSFELEFQQKIWDLAEKKIEFGFGLTFGFSHNLLSLSQEILERIDKFLSKRSRYAEGFTYGLISYEKFFLYLENKNIIQYLLNIAEGNDDIYLGNLFGQSIIDLDRETQQRIWDLTEKNKYGEFANGLGSSLVHNFSSLDKETQQRIWDLTEKNKESANPFTTGFDYAVGYSFGHNFSSLDKETQQRIWDLTEKNKEFGSGLGVGLSYSFQYLNQETQEAFLNLVEENRAFGWKFLHFMKFESLSKDMQVRILDLCERHSEIAFKVGEHFKPSLSGLEDLDTRMLRYQEQQFSLLSKGIQDRIFELGKKNKAFAKGSDFANKDSVFWKKIKENFGSHY